MWIKVDAGNFSQDFGESPTALKEAKAWVKVVKKEKVKDPGAPLHSIRIVETYDKRILEAWDWNYVDSKWERDTWSAKGGRKFTSRRLY